MRTNTSVATYQDQKFLFLMLDIVLRAGGTLHATPQQNACLRAAKHAIASEKLLGTVEALLAEAAVADTNLNDSISLSPTPRAADVTPLKVDASYSLSTPQEKRRGSKTPVAIINGGSSSNSGNNSAVSSGGGISSNSSGSVATQDMLLSNSRRTSSVSSISSNLSTSADRSRANSASPSTPVLSDSIDAVERLREMEAAAAAATAAAIKAESERIQAQLEHERAAAEAAAAEVRKRKELAEREYEAKRREQAEAAEREFERRRKEEAARLQGNTNRTLVVMDDLVREDNDRLVFQSPSTSISSAFNTSLRFEEDTNVIDVPSISKPSSDEIVARRKRAESMSMSQLSQETKKRLGLNASLGLAECINEACKLQGIKTTGNLKADAIAAYVGQR